MPMWHNTIGGAYTSVETTQRAQGRSVIYTDNWLACPPAAGYGTGANQSGSKYLFLDGVHTNERRATTLTYQRETPLAP